MSFPAPHRPHLGREVASLLAAPTKLSRNVADRPQRSDASCSMSSDEHDELHVSCAGSAPHQPKPLVDLRAVSRPTLESASFTKSDIETVRYLETVFEF